MQLIISFIVGLIVGMLFKGHLTIGLINVNGNKIQKSEEENADNQNI